LKDLYIKEFLQIIKLDKMKHQRIFSTEMVVITLLLAVIASFTYCSNKNAGETGSGNISPGSEQAIKPPAMDLHTAALLGDLEVVRQHIEAGSDLDVREPSAASSPLITACVFGKTEVAIALIEAGADVNLTNNEGSTPLHCAAFLCHTEIVESLLANGADKSIRNIYGSTPYASVSGPFDPVKVIYDQFSRDLGPLGLKLDYSHLEQTRPVIAGLLE
jgi:hypothetical protein